MFDDVFGTAEHCTEAFRGGVHDAFGDSIVANVLEPILAEIGLLRAFHEEFQHQSTSIEKVLEEVRMLKLNDRLC